VATAKQKIRVAVIGTGSLGKEHARIYAEMAAAGKVDFAGVYDANPDAARTHAAKHKVRALTSIDEAIEVADALNVVTPTVTHFDIARQLLDRGKHVLVEKPMTDDVGEAGELVSIARRNNLLLQVGHVERFNPVFKYLESVAKEPRFIESHRLSPFPARSTDIGVVLDLMIHDLDIVLAFVKSPVVSVDAVGIPVLSKSEDIANARLRFANGCIANLTASRISRDRVRKIRFFQPAAYLSIDYAAQKVEVWRLTKNDGAMPSIQGGELPVTNEEPLKRELADFVAAVRDRRAPLVDGVQGRRALELATRITSRMAS
jgi:predicted dehydrogenase